MDDAELVKWNSAYSDGVRDGYRQGVTNTISKINDAEDRLVKCFKKQDEIWTIRLAFAELRDCLSKEEKNG